MGMDRRAPVDIEGAVDMACWDRELRVYIDPKQIEMWGVDAFDLATMASTSAFTVWYTPQEVFNGFAP